MHPTRVLLVALVATALAAPPTRAADHQDGGFVRIDPTTDINDVYAWMSSDAQRLIVAMSAAPFSTANTRFSDAAQYIFRLQGQASFGAPAGPTYDIICEFGGGEPQGFECWAGNDEYLSGAINRPQGFQTSNGRFRVFAGLRNDPFFFNLRGFLSLRTLVAAELPSVARDESGCPQFRPELLRQILGDIERGTATVPSVRLSDGSGGPSRDDFGNANVLFIVVSLDKSLVTGDGELVSVVATTRRK